MPWRYNRKTKQYEDSEGNPLSNSDMVALRDIFSGSRKTFTDQHTRDLAAGDISLQTFEARMRAELRTAFIDQFVLARGGRGMMRQSDWGSTGGMLANQYRWLSGFVKEIATGTMTEGQIRARAQLYMDASTQAYEKGKVSASGMPPLSRVPGDGRLPSTCGVRCKCNLLITEDSDNWYVVWVLGPVKKKHCDGCVEMSRLWSPLIIPKAA